MLQLNKKLSRSRHGASRRYSRQPRSLHGERLENRALLAGMVTAGFDPNTGILNLTGDGRANQVAVQVSEGGRVSVEGDNTRLNRRTAPLEFTGVTGIVARLGGGGDRIGIAGNSRQNLAALDSVFLDMGGGDQNKVDLSTIFIRDVRVIGGAERDAVSLQNSSFVSVNAMMGAGENSFSFVSSSAGSVNVTGGRQVDKIDLLYSQIDTINLRLRKGDDTVRLLGLSGNSGSKVRSIVANLGGGKDTVTLQNVKAKSATLNGGRGADDSVTFSGINDINRLAVRRVERIS